MLLSLSFVLRIKKKTKKKQKKKTASSHTCRSVFNRLENKGFTPETPQTFSLAILDKFVFAENIKNKLIKSFAFEDSPH